MRISESFKNVPTLIQARMKYESYCLTSKDDTKIQGKQIISANLVGLGQIS